MKRWIMFVVFSLFIGQLVTPVQADSTAINKRLGRGINMGNMLESPKEGDWGSTLDENYFTIIAKRGFTSVRIPIRWSGEGRLGSTPPYTINPQFFERVDRAINAALKAHLAVVINFHHFDGLFSDPEREHDRFLAAWKQVSSHYRSYPETLVFEILNEPHDKLTPDKWNVLLREVLVIIRQTNPKRTVLIGTAEWGGPGGLATLDFPKNDKHLILTVHYYNPFHFTHQGAGWAGKESQSWLGTTWNGTYAEKLSVLNELQPVKDFSDATGIPVYIGEFGAYSKGDIASRARWTAYCARLFESLGFSWAYWEFCAGFGAYDPQNKVWREELANALISSDTSILTSSDQPAHKDTRSDFLRNGMFAEGMNYWKFGAWQGQATGSIEQGVFSVKITNPSTASWHIQLLQGDLTYYDGNRYVVTFEAWSDQVRTIVVGAENGKNFNSFGNMSVQLSPTPKIYSFRFVKIGDDQQGRISFSFGAQSATVHLRNIRVYPEP